MLATGLMRFWAFSMLANLVVATCSRRFERMAAEVLWWLYSNMKMRMGMLRHTNTRDSTALSFGMANAAPVNLKMENRLIRGRMRTTSDTGASDEPGPREDAFTILLNARLWHPLAPHHRVLRVMLHIPRAGSRSAARPPS